jgi:Ca2+-binding EF-hand superfamily protein
MGIKIPQSQCRELFDKFDTDGSGDLDLQEFVSALMPKDYTEVKAVRSFNRATFSLCLLNYK